MSNNDEAYESVKQQGRRVKRSVAHKAITLPNRDSAHKALPIETDDMEKALQELDRREKQGKQ